MFVLAMSLLGLFLRINFIHNVPTQQLFDFSTYHEVANNIYNNLGFTFKGHPIAFQGMGYSSLLGYWFKLWQDNSALTAKYLNVIMSMATIYLIYYMIKRLTQERFIIYTVMITSIFLPNHIAYCNVIGSEVMSSFLLAGTIALQVAPIKSKYQYPLLGLAVGLMALTKPFFLMYPLLLALVVWLKNKAYREAFKMLVFVFLFMGLVVAPWTIRNYKAFGRLIPVSYNSGFNLYINNNPNNVHGGWQSFNDIYKSQDLNDKIYRHLDIYHEGQKLETSDAVKLAHGIEKDFKPEAGKWIRSNPLEFMKLGVIRVHSTYFNGAWDINAWTMNAYKDHLLMEKDEKLVQRSLNFMQATFDIFFSIISGLGLLFIVMNFKRVVFSIFNKNKVDELTSIVFLNLSYMSLTYFVYEGQPRYSFLVLFLLTMASAIIINGYRVTSVCKNDEQQF